VALLSIAIPPVVFHLSLVRSVSYSETKSLMHNLEVDFLNFSLIDDFFLNFSLKTQKYGFLAHSVYNFKSMGEVNSQIFIGMQ
jgi:hypothetical protein